MHRRVLLKRGCGSSGLHFCCRSAFGKPMARVCVPRQAVSNARGNCKPPGRVCVRARVAEERFDSGAFARWEVKPCPCIKWPKGRVRSRQDRVDHVVGWFSIFPRPSLMTPPRTRAPPVRAVAISLSRAHRWTQLQSFQLSLEPRQVRIYQLSQPQHCHGPIRCSSISTPTTQP